MKHECELENCTKTAVVFLSDYCEFNLNGQAIKRYALNGAHRYCQHHSREAMPVTASEDDIELWDITLSEAQGRQDALFTTILSSIDGDCIAIPESVTNKDEFYRWVKTL